MFSITNVHVESTAKPKLTVDEIEQIQPKRIASIIGDVLELTHAAICDKFIHEAKVNHCNIRAKKSTQNRP